MVLIDTSVWLAHFDRPIAAVAALAEVGEAATHPLVVGDLAMRATLTDRRAVLRAFGLMRSLRQATHAEAMLLIDWRHLFEDDIGYADAHLLASVRFTDGCRLWTHDPGLLRQAEWLGIAYAA